MTDPNSMLVWWPKIKDLGIPVPRTEIIPIDREEMFDLFDGKTPKTLVTAVAEVRKTAKKFGYPFFLRTDLSSAKHSWKETCFVSSPEEVQSHISSLCEQHELWTLIGLNYQALAVREMLSLETSFTAFSGEMPINKEFRFFIQDGDVVCHHFYWPEEAFNSHPSRMVSEGNWKEKLKELSFLPDCEYLILAEHAQKVSKACPGFWSADFAKGKNKQWYLIDMALGKNSYHWPGCSNAN